MLHGESLQATQAHRWIPPGAAAAAAAAAATAAGAATAVRTNHIKARRTTSGTDAPVAPRTLGLFTFPGFSTPTVVP